MTSLYQNRVPSTPPPASDIGVHKVNLYIKIPWERVHATRLLGKRLVFIGGAYWERHKTYPILLNHHPLCPYCVFSIKQEPYPLYLSLQTSGRMKLGVLRVKSKCLSKECIQRLKTYLILFNHYSFCPGSVFGIR